MDAIIKLKLEELKQHENINFIMVAELGNKAWGLSSQQSGSCIRFIYKRQKDDYFRLDSIGDTIRWSPSKDVDICGWDLRKVLQSLHASKPVIFELLNSPIIYYHSDTFSKLKDISNKYFSSQKSLAYYYNVAFSHYKEYLNSDHICVDDYFHVLRPLLSAKWIMTNNCPPPLVFSELLDSEFPENLKEEIDKLILLKNNYSEMKYALKIVILNEYIEQMLNRLKKVSSSVEETNFDWNELNQFFLSEI